MRNFDGIKVIRPTNLYKWNSNYFKLQQSFFVEPFTLLREKQIKDFVELNQFDRVCLIKDTDIFQNGLGKQLVSDYASADLTVITDQRFARVPCPAIIEHCLEILQHCPLYLCLNRHYINIDNSYHDDTLSDDFEVAITQWLTKNLKGHRVIDLSFRWDDRGDYLSWSVPDRHYFIQ